MECLKIKEKRQRKKLTKKIGKILKIFNTFILTATLVLTAITLYQNKINRDSAYMPLLKCYTNSNIYVMWSENDIKKVEPPEIKLKIQNIGNGVADNVKVRFDLSVFSDWVEILSSLNPDGNYEYIKDKSGISVCINQVSVKDKKTKDIEIDYILPGEENAINIELPLIYRVALQELCKWSNQNNGVDCSFLKFDLECFDVQGKVVRYEVEFELQPKEVGAIDSYDGKGKILTAKLISNRK